MFDRIIIYFFYFFLLSRFFSEKLGILPKYFDMINFPFFAIILFLSVLSIKKKFEKSSKETRTIYTTFIIITLTFFISIFFNTRRILPEGTILFYLGFLEGPILYISLELMSRNKNLLLTQINRIFLVLLIINVILVFIVDIPIFLITKNPDIISGTYGNGTYQFSMLLIICGGYLLGYNFINKRKTWIVVISQLVILFIFYLSQFRSALPFFIFAYIVMLAKLYGSKILKITIPVAIMAIISFSVISNLTKEEEAVSELRYEDWLDIISQPEKFMGFGKFQVYFNVLDMWKEYPETMVIGTGPGNFMSRANYTFTYELRRTDKGVGEAISKVFGINQPYYTDLHIKYIMNGLKVEVIFGTWQLSNPYTSYLAGITEIGIIGGITIIFLYLFLIKSSLRFFKNIYLNNNKYLPLSLALIGGTIYLFCLAFLDNYWETSRVTLPVWLLFWAVKTAAYQEPEEINNSQK